MQVISVWSQSAFKVSIVDGCVLTRIANLPFGCAYCACNTFDFDGKEKIVFGFHMSNAKQSMSYDGSSFDELPESSHAHITIGKIGIYKQSPFVVAGGNYVSKTEILNSNVWSDAADYPFAKG